jgi:hypothetical protein
MELLGQTLVLYLLVGVAIAVAVYLSDLGGSTADRWFRVGSALPFWPLYLPILLAQVRVSPPNSPPAPRPAAADEMTAAIVQVDAELDAALHGLDGWASDVLAREKGRLSELRVAWNVQAERIREMDRLLALPDTTTPASATSERLRHSQQARQQNLDRLRRVRQRAYDDLMGMLAWVRELVSMIHLAKFTGAPAARAEELLAQIAAAVEGLSQVAAIEEPEADGASCATNGRPNVLQS